MWKQQIPATNSLSPCLYDVVLKGLSSVQLNANIIKELEMKDVACKVRMILRLPVPC